MTVLPDSVANRIAEELTPTEGRVLDFIVAFRDQYDHFPNDHDMRGEFASGSLQAVRYHVDKLERRRRRSSPACTTSPARRPVQEAPAAPEDNGG